MHQKGHPPDLFKQLHVHTIIHTHIHHTSKHKYLHAFVLERFGEALIGPLLHTSLLKLLLASLQDEQFDRRNGQQMGRHTHAWFAYAQRRSHKTVDGGLFRASERTQAIGYMSSRICRGGRRGGARGLGDWGHISSPVFLGG